MCTLKVESLQGDVYTKSRVQGKQSPDVYTKSKVQMCTLKVESKCVH